MGYFGGKHNIANRLVSAMQVTDLYIEPFVGGCSVISRVKAPRRIGSDINKAVISMWRAIQGGWDPPEYITEDEYRAAVYLSDNDPFKAYCALSSSYSGKYSFVCYARSTRPDRARDGYAKGYKRSILSKMELIRDIDFYAADYRNIEYPSGSTVYCDPPYDGMSSGYSEKTFNTEEFWEFFRKLASKHKIRIYISEYKAPKDWITVIEIPTKIGIRSKTGCDLRIEKLFTYPI